MTPPQVRVTIISESQANAFLKTDNKISDSMSSGEILNNSGTMEYHSATRQLSVNFRNMQLRKIKRTEKKGTESVMDEKFSLFFQSKFKVGGGELVFEVWVSLLPASTEQFTNRCLPNSNCRPCSDSPREPRAPRLGNSDLGQCFR